MIAFVNALQPKTPQGTPVVEQVGLLIVAASEHTHHGGPWVSQ